MHLRPKRLIRSLTPHNFKILAADVSVCGCCTLDGVAIYPSSAGGKGVNDSMKASRLQHSLTEWSPDRCESVNRVMLGCGNSQSRSRYCLEFLFMPKHLPYDSEATKGASQQEMFEYFISRPLYEPRSANR